MADLVLAITGGSGAIYAVRLLDVLLRAGRNVQLTISPAGKTVIETELGVSPDLDDFQPEMLSFTSAVPALSEKIEQFWGPDVARAAKASQQPTSGSVRYYHYQNYMAPMASGSARSDGMVICPASGGTISAIAHGASENLIDRAAAVHLKERRRLVLVPRETPLSTIQLDNLRRCAEAGAVVLPAMPGYYHGATTVGHLVDFVVARICDQIDVEQKLMSRWGE